VSRLVIGATWQDSAPHLDETAKAELAASYPKYQLDARTRGIPQLGSGAIYPFPESGVRVEDFPIPKHYRRGFGLDTALSGTTAAVWGALDAESQVLYIYSVYKRAQAEIAVHAEALRARGAWIPGVGDAADVIDEDRTQFISLYRRHGFNLELPDKAVETGIYDVYNRLSEGKLKVFASCQAWFAEFRLYRRDDKHRVVKSNDHLLDACVIGSTGVVTPDGIVPIASLVGTRGRILTREGVWATFLGARRTIINSPIVDVRFSDGSVVTCTPDHPFLTPTGWVRADALRGAPVYNGITQRVQWKRFLYRYFQRPARCSKAFAITCADAISAVVASLSIRPSMWPPTDRFHSDITCITRMGIPPTTTSGTWRPNWDRNIFPTTSAAVPSDHFPQRPAPLRSSGMAAPTAGAGTRSTIRRLRGFFISVGRWCARIPVAASDSTGSTTTRQNSAQRTAGPPLVARLVWTMRNACAWAAAAVLWRVVTIRQSPARDAAVLSCVSVVPAGRADVYCLTVPGASAFVVHNGAVVHNTRYLVRSGLSRMITEPLPVEPQETLIYDMGERSGLGWMR